MNAADHHLLSKVNHQTKLIFWVTNKTLSPSLDGFRAVDYLTNGLVTHTLGVNPVINEHLFVAEQFNRPLYIYFSTSTNVNLESINEVIKAGLAPEDIYLVWGDKKMNEEFVTKLPSQWRERCLDI
jgi:hypothetical protein